MASISHRFSEDFVIILERFGLDSNCPGSVLAAWARFWLPGMDSSCLGSILDAWAGVGWPWAGPGILSRAGLGGDQGGLMGPIPLIPDG